MTIERFPRKLADDLLNVVKDLLTTRAALVARGEQLRTECDNHGQMVAQTQQALQAGCQFLRIFGVALPKECNCLVGLNEDGTDIAF